MAADKDIRYPDDSQGIVRSNIVRPHRLAAGTQGPITPIHEHRRSDGHHNDVRRRPYIPLAEEDRLNQIAASETNYLGHKPVPNITPKYGPTENGKREYKLQLELDKMHGGYHVVRMVLGKSGGGQVEREVGAAIPLCDGEEGIDYRRRVSISHFSFEELIQMALCACDARGMTFSDACRFIEQTLKNMQDQLPEPPQRGA